MPEDPPKNPDKPAVPIPPGLSPGKDAGGAVVAERKAARTKPPSLYQVDVE